MMNHRDGMGESIFGDFCGDVLTNSGSWIG